MTTVVLIAIIIIGFALIIFSVLKKDNDMRNERDSEYSKKIIKIERLLKETDDAIDELNKQCEEAFEQFDEKYQEMLFIYQMVEEKKNEVNKSFDKEVKASTRKSDFNYHNPKLAEIRKLQGQGFSIPEIAKKLNMGQGEVKLIAELGKAR